MTRRAYLFFRLLHPFPSLLVAGLTLALVPVANSNSEPSRYVSLGVGMLLFQFCIGVTNDLVDSADDAVEKPWKPLAAGVMSHRSATILAFALGIAGLAFTAPVGPRAWLVGVAGLACGLSYDLRVKRSPLSWLPWSLAFPLIPTWVWVATSEWSPFLLWVWPLGALFGLSLHLANQAPDAAGDAAQGIDSLVQRLGDPWARRLAVGLFIVGAAIASAAVLVRSPLSAIVIFIAAMIPLVGIGGFARTSKRVADFPILAVATVLIALVFMLVV